LFDIQKNVGFSRLMEMAKFIFRCSLPIKCMEALILSIYLTNQIHRLVRFPISFVSAQNDHFYYHIGRVSFQCTSQVQNGWSEGINLGGPQSGRSREN